MTPDPGAANQYGAAAAVARRRRRRRGQAARALLATQSQGRHNSRRCIYTYSSPTKWDGVLSGTALAGHSDDNKYMLN